MTTDGRQVRAAREAASPGHRSAGMPMPAGLGTHRLQWACLVVACGAVLAWLVAVGAGRGPDDAASAKVHAAAVPAGGGAGSVRYGGLPGWLPKASVPVGRILHASRRHPVLAVQGETVAVAVPPASALVTAAGPAVPEEGKVPVPDTSPCTFVVTFAHASAPIPLRAASFTLLDERGHVHHPRVTALGGGPMPAQISPGRTVSVLVRDVLPTGDGGLLWRPYAGRPIVSWDYDVEID
jgi:hypothetical protein